MRKLFLMCAALLISATTALAGNDLSLKDITFGKFAPKGIGSITALDDGETYATALSHSRAGCIGTIKGFKNVCKIFLVDSYSVVFYRNDDGFFVIFERQQYFAGYLLL